MIEGLLWLDPDPKRDLAEKVTRAADRYHYRFGCRPNMCYVNEDQWPALPDAIDGVRLVGASNILRHHFWIGVDGVNERDDCNSVLVCRRCGAEAIDPQATCCWSCGWDGRE
jgi:hypothetical protein